MKIIYIIVLLCALPLWAQDFNVGIDQGQAVELEMEETSRTKKERVIPRSEQRYWFKIKRLSDGVSEFIFSGKRGDDLPFNGGTPIPLVVEHNWLAEVGQYDLFGWTERFVAGNPEGEKFLRGDSSAVIRVTVNQLAPSIADFFPKIGPVGTKITITGVRFVDVTSVLINGVSGQFTVVNEGRIDVIVPEGNTTGNIVVTVANGSVAISAEKWQLRDLDKPKKLILRVTGSGTAN